MSKHPQGNTIHVYYAVQLVWHLRYNSKLVFRLPFHTPWAWEILAVAVFYRVESGGV